LVGLAERTGCAVLGLTHVVKASKKKHPLERIIGGVGLGAVVRVAMLVARDDSGGFGSVREWNVLVKAKANICREDGGFLYRMVGEQIPTSRGPVESSKIQWGAALPGSAMDILNCAEGTEPGASAGKCQEAGNFLLTMLESGPCPALEVKARAAEAGISEATLRRAREQLGVESQKQRGAGSASPHLWSLPMQSAGGGMTGVRNILDLGVSTPQIAPGYLGGNLFTQQPIAGQPTNGVWGNARGNGLSAGQPGPAFGQPYYPSPSSPDVGYAAINGFEHVEQVEQHEQVEQVNECAQRAGVPQPTESMTGETGIGDRHGALDQPQADAGVVASFLGYALDEAKRELQRRPLTAGGDVESYLTNVVEAVIGGYEDQLNWPEKSQLSEALWTALLPYIAGNPQ
jgi:hypothetical protein